ncbi:MAG: hypothetical protein CMI26_06350 [Opitutae bacterium]|nr:hypothetical protein [Opitutae bacterium]|tara:strand:+ start:741 stop:2051 length:1311 start_codon:yes stop_codon:yes gene_type:complete
MSADETIGISGGKTDLSTKCLGAAAIGLGGGLIGIFMGVANGDKNPFLGWLWGTTFWLSIAIGMLMLVMLFRVFNSQWTPVVRRQMEHCLAVFPWLGLCFLPLILVVWFGGDQAGVLWNWVNPASDVPVAGEVHKVGHDVLLQKKSSYLNVFFFSIRVIGYFAIFCSLSYWMRKVSFTQDRDGDSKWTQLGHNISAAGLPAGALALTFGAFDWFMSLEYHWFSTMFGVWFFAASIRAGLAVAIILCFVLATRTDLKGFYNFKAHQYDLACLSLAFTVFWAYISFSQYFLIYNANIPEETFWYVIREINPNTGERTGWFWVSMGLIFGHFLIPFLSLLWYRNKVEPNKTLKIVVWILCFHLLDLYWNIIPGRIPNSESAVGYDIRYVLGTQLIWGLFTLVGVGGLCIWAVLKSYRESDAEIIPVRDPRIKASINYHE